MLIRVPHPAILRPYLARGLWLCPLVRLAVIATAVFPNRPVPPELLVWTLGGSLGTLSVCGLLGLVDTRRRHERALLGNLGVGDREIVLMYVAGGAIFELAFALLTAR